MSLNALSTDAAARPALFDDLSYSQKSWYVLPIEDAKTPATRERRIARAVGLLLEGRKR